jgi:hypothetical protein
MNKEQNIRIAGVQRAVWHKSGGQCSGTMKEKKNVEQNINFLTKMSVRQNESV